jgi:hypothetical protein
MPSRTAVFLTFSGLLGAPAFAQTTQPLGAQSTQPVSSADDKYYLDDVVELCIQSNHYELALRLLKQAAAVTTDPKRLAVLRAKILDCQSNVVPTSAAARVPHKVPSAGTTLELSLNQLGNFDYDQDKGGNIPADVKALTGAKVRLRGYMIPMDQAEKITQFALETSREAQPLIQHMVVVDCPKDKPLAYCPDEIVVEGTLNVQEKKDGGFIISIFEVACTSVRPAPR